MDKKRRKPKGRDRGYGRVLKLLETCASVSDLARELGCSEVVLLNWIQYTAASHERSFRLTRQRPFAEIATPQGHPDDLQAWLRGLT